jgi:hypothetical protein
MRKLYILFAYYIKYLFESDYLEEIFYILNLEKKLLEFVY